MKASIFRFFTGHHESAQAGIAALQKALAASERAAAARHKESMEHFMALSAQAQALIDQVTQTKSIEQASALALQSLVTDSGSLKQQIADLQAKVDAGTSSAEDLAAITKAASDLHDSATALATATPANTNPATPPAGAQS